MQTVKTTADYTIVKKRSGRYGVQDKQKKWIRAEEKVKILMKEKLIKQDAPKPKAAEESSEAAS